MNPRGEALDASLSNRIARSLLSVSIVIALLAILGGVLIQASNEEAPRAFHAQVEFFALFSGISIFFLAAAKYLASRERVYLYLSFGFFAASLFDLLHPAVASQIVPAEIMGLHFEADSSAGYFWWFGRIALGLGFLLGALAHRSHQLDPRPGRSILRVVVGGLLGLFASVAFVGAVPLSDYYGATGTGRFLEFLPLLLYLPAVFVLLGTEKERSGGLRTFGLSALLLSVVVQLFALISTAPYDPFFFASHVIKVGSYLSILFGLYVEHMGLYSAERTLRESMERAHEDLKLSKTELDTIIENMTDGIAIADADGRLVRLNRAAKEVLGREVLGVGPERYAEAYGVQTVDGRPFPAREQPIATVLATGREVREVEMVVRQPSGNRRRLIVGASPLYDARGQIRGAVAAFHDVTEIRAAEERFRDLTDGAPDGVIVIDRKRRITLFNQVAERMFGYRRDEVFGRDVTVLMPERSQDLQTQALEDLFRSGPKTLAGGTLRFQGLRKDGREFPIEMILNGSHTAAGPIVIGHLHDATDQDRSRREREGIFSVLKVSSTSTSLEELLAAIPAAINQSTGFDACTIYLPNPSRKTFELRASANIPEEIQERIRRYPLRPDFPSIAVQTWFKKRTLIEPRLQDRTDLPVGPTLSAKYGFAVVLSTLIGTPDDPIGVLQVVTDETRHPREEDIQIIELLAQELAFGIRQKELLRQLEESSQSLRTANQELDSFIYTASHDLAEPLRSISNFSHFLLEDYSDQMDAEGRDYLERVHRGALRMKRLLDDLLRLSRFGRTQASRGRVEVDDVVREVRESLDATLRERHAEVEVRSPLPPALADRTSLLEVFTNLVGNGVKFNENPKPRVEIGGHVRDGWIEYYVKDNGIGVPPEHQERIFGLFTRLHNRKDYPGTGAGLAIVKKIVEQHGGRVWVESTPGQGSTFRFTMPAPGEVSPIVERTPTSKPR